MLRGDFVAAKNRRLQAQQVGEHDGVVHPQRESLHQRARLGLDMAQMLAGQLQRCFEGPLSLAFVEGLLSDWQPEHWTAGERARLRVLVCERAFESGGGLSMDATTGAPPTLLSIVEKLKDQMPKRTDPVPAPVSSDE